MDILLIVVTALAPGVEARGAYPLAYVLGYSGLTIFTLIYVVSSLPSIPILYILKWFEEKIIYRIGFLKKIYSMVLERVREKAGKVAGYNIVYVGLALYVAIPLPGTGVWTGSLIAYILDLDKIKSIISIFAGNLIACVIIYSVVYSVSIMF